MAITLQTITERAQGIHRSFTERFDIEHAKQEAEQLYQEGLQLVHAEVNGKPLLKEIVSSVVFELNEVIPLGSIQHQVPLHQTFSKVYRVFIELTWYQCWRQRQQPVYSDYRDKIIANSNLVMTVLPEDQIGVRFEYSCAEQAAKCLTPSEKIWKKYLDHLLNLGEAAEGGSTFGIVKAFKALDTEAGKDWIQKWYLDIHPLRWISTRIRNMQDFNAMIVPELQKFKDKGGNYTLCLATIFMDLIKNPTVEDQVKIRAAMGFVDIFLLEDQDWISQILNGMLKKIPLNPIQKAAKREDRYLLTRTLILQSIEELVKEGNYPYLEESIKALVTVQRKSIHADERRAIQLKLQELSREKAKFQQDIEEKEEYLESTGGENRAGEEEEIQQVKEALQEAVKEQESIEQDFRTLESIEKTYREEQERLARIESLLSKQQRITSI
jgi:hypothetical protein